jgi:VWFA-related protein
VVYLNRIEWQHGNYVEPALIEFLDRTMGPRDYVAVMTAMQSPGDLVFGQLTAGFKLEAKRFLDVVDWTDPAFMTPAELELLTCFPVDGLSLIARWRADDVYRDLEGLVSLLGSLRETRSTLIFVSEGMFDPSEAPAITRQPGKTPVFGPPAGLVPLPGGRGTFQPSTTPVASGRCEGLRRAALEPWASNRFRDLLDSARTANVALSPINARGLVASADPEVTREAERANDRMRTMASETGGLAIVNLNDMRDGFRRVADSLTSHYVLSYYSSNRAQDGRVRRITVKLTSTRETVRARREYRAPSPADMAPGPSPSAPAAPETPDAILRALSELEAAEREDEPRRPRPGPRLFRAASPPAAPWMAAPGPVFARTQRLKAEWTAGAGSTAGLPVAVRLLARDGRVLALTFEMASDSQGQTRAASMSLAPLAIGLYVIEAEFADGRREHTAFRIA